MVLAKNIEEWLDHKYLQEITKRYHSDPRKEGGTKKECNRIFINKKIAIKVFMDCRTTSTHKFRTRLEFKQYDVILTK